MKQSRLFGRGKQLVAVIEVNVWQQRIQRRWSNLTTPEVNLWEQILRKQLQLYFF